MHVSKRKRRTSGTGPKDKTAVLGILERGGKIRTKVVPNVREKQLQAEYADALRSVQLSTRMP